MTSAAGVIAAVRACGGELRVCRGKLRLGGHERVSAHLRTAIRARAEEIVNLLEDDGGPAEPVVVDRPGPKGWQDWDGRFPAGWTSAATNPPCVRCGFTTFARDASGAPNHPFHCV